MAHSPMAHDARKTYPAALSCIIIRSPVRPLWPLTWLIRASWLIRGSIVHRINRITPINHAIPAAGRLTMHVRTTRPRCHDVHRPAGRHAPAPASSCPSWPRAPGSTAPAAGAAAPGSAYHSRPATSPNSGTGNLTTSRDSRRPGPRRRPGVGDSSCPGDNGSNIGHVADASRGGMVQNQGVRVYGESGVTPHGGEAT